MPYSFLWTDYGFKDRWTGQDYVRGTSIIEEGVRSTSSAQSILDQLKEAGLSYRRTDFLRDYSLAMATEQSKDAFGYGRARQFWNAVEAYREQFEVTDRGKAIQFVKAWHQGVFETLEDEQDAAVLEGMDYVPGS